MNNWFKRNSVHIIIVAILIAISYAYFFTPLMAGKALSQSDVVQAQGMQKEIMDTRAKTGHEPLWTNSMFGGMPSYQIHVQYTNSITSYVIQFLKAVFPNPVDTVLLYLLGAYLLFCVLRINPWLAAAGAIAFGFSSYNFILIYAGHANQAYAIAFFAPLVAGIILTLRGKHWLGFSLTAFFLAMEIRANHIQMTYYLFLALFILLGIEIYHAIKDKQLKAFGKSIVFVVAAIVLGVAVNASMLWTTAEYGKETNRGQSNLTQHTTEPSNGLAKDYAYQWSQGVGECFTFLIPNAYGGGSGLSEINVQKSEMTKAFVAQGATEEQAESTVPQLEQVGISTYWGGKQFTGGPFYFGAVICFLFIFGLIIVKSRLKWWLLGAVVLTMLLSFGRNWPYVSDIFFNYFPMYNKFRAVESILAVAGLCFPILAFLAVQEVVNTKDKAPIFKSLQIAGGITLVLLIIPSLFFDFRAPGQENILANLTQALKGNGAFANSIMNGLVQDRKTIEFNDALRSLIFVAIAFGLLWAFIKQKVSVTIISVGFAALVLFDMWGIDRRYLNDGNFVDKEDVVQPIKPTDVDQIILRDTDPDFRVFDLSAMGRGTTPFADSRASYFFKSVGGYHAAKLKRFDELIDNQFSKGINNDVLDMLNTKYIITFDQKTGAVGMQANQTACGHAWFVKTVKFVDNADQEMQAISTFGPKDEAIVDKQYKSQADLGNVSIDLNATIKLDSYTPEHLVYSTGSTTPQIALFSEIYYKEGWKMYIDGKESPYFRADYLLRAAQIPVGNHKVEFIFHPASYYVGEDISLAGSLLLVLALGGAAYVENKKKPAPEKPAAKKA